MTKKPFTMMELLAALTVFLICMDLISQIIIQSHKGFQHSDSRFTIILVMENVLEELDPHNYTTEDLKTILAEEDKLNEMSKKGISWKIKQNDDRVSLEFIHKEKVVYSTDLVLP